MRERSYLNKLFTFRFISYFFYLTSFLLFAIPLFYVFSKSLSLKIFFDKYIQNISLFTLKQALISSILSVLIGLFTSLLIKDFKGKTKAKLYLFLSLAFLLPSILVVLGFINIWGNNGILNRLLMYIFSLKEPPLKILYSFKAIIMAHLFYNIPLAIIMISGYYSKIGSNTESSSLVLGYSRFTTFFKITLRRLTPSLISSFILIFIYCFHSFAIVLILGSGPKLTTIEVEIFRRAKDISLLASASSLSFYSALFTLLLALLFLSSSKSNYKSEESYFLKEDKKKGFLDILKVLYLILLFAFLFLPIISIIVLSFIKNNNFTLANYIKLFSDSYFYSSLYNSLLIGLFSALFTTLSALFISHSLRFASRFKIILTQSFIILPLATSSIIMGFGYFLISRELRMISPLISVSLAHSIVALPIALGLIKNSYDRLSLEKSQSALILGDNKFRAFLKIDLRHLSTAIVASFIVSFALSLAELNTTLVITDSSFTTLSVMLYYAISTQDINLSCSIGSLLMLITILVAKIMNKGIINE